MRRPVWGTPTFGRDVQSMFTAISGSYSLFDHVSTFGGDLIWRPRALWGADRLSEGSPRRILDIGCGPGDLTRLLPQHYPGAEVYGLDFTPAMVHRAAGISARRSGPTQPAGFLAGDALHLPFRASTFDMVTSAFLLRNLPDLRAGFAEMRRVLRPGGTFLALDVTEPPPGGLLPVLPRLLRRRRPDARGRLREPRGVPLPFDLHPSPASPKRGGRTPGFDRLFTGPGRTPVDGDHHGLPREGSERGLTGPR